MKKRVCSKKEQKKTTEQKSRISDLWNRRIIPAPEKAAPISMNDDCLWRLLQIDSIPPAAAAPGTSKKERQHYAPPINVETGSKGRLIRDIYSNT